MNLLLDKYLKNNIQNEEVLSFGRVRDIKQLTYHDALQISTRLIDDLIRQNHQETEVKTEISKSKYSESIENLHQFNSKLYYIKQQLRKLFDAPNERRVERIMENKGE